MIPEADWRDLDPTALSRAYDNSGAVADSAARVASWRERSAAFRAGHPEELDIPYGPRPRNRIDLYRAGAERAPLVAFIHGGYWQRNDKEGFACMAEGPLALGLDVALIGYTLAPEASLTEIAGEIDAALRLLRSTVGSDGRRIVVGGWSAGGHLAALAGTNSGIDATLSISGIFDLAPIKRTNLNAVLHLTDDEVDALSPMRQIAKPMMPAIVAYGERELPELRRQSRDYQAACASAGHATTLMPIGGDDHFSILDELISPDGILAKAAADLAAG